MNEKVEVLITLPFTNEQIEMLAEISPQLNIRIIRTFKLEEIPADVWATIDVLYTDNLLPTHEQAPKLKWIQFHWAGINHAIDAPIMNKPDLKVTTLSGAQASTVAEHAVMMMLALGHLLRGAIDLQLESKWPNDRWKRFLPVELRNSTVGIIGYGSIGRQIASLLKPFGAFVLATKRDVMKPEDKGYSPQGWGDPEGKFVYRLYPFQAIRSMVKECDFVVLTLPLTPQTNSLINKEVLYSMKPTAYLIDVSRGGVLDQEAMIEALKEHKIAGAALDVFPEEPLPAKSPLWKLSNVIITPHIAGITPYYDQRASEMFAENLKRYLAGLTLFNLFDPDNGY